jgi:hypothetical protein
MRRRDEAGFWLLDILVGMSIMILVFISIHMSLGNAVSAKLMASNRIAGQNQGRQAVEWIADRVRQAGFRADPASSIPRCRNGIVSQDVNYYPTTTSLWVTGDVDDDDPGAPGRPAEMRGYRIETVNGVPALTETVLQCVNNAVASDQPVTDTTAVKVLSLTFAYYDANGNPPANLTTPAAIQTIRNVQVTVVVRALAGRSGPTDQTWTTRIALRNP